MSTDSTDQPPPPGATARSALVHVENKTDHYIDAQVLHLYTNGKIEDTNFERIDAGENKFMLKVNYWTGIETTGCDNWKVNVIRYVETGEFNDDGTKRYRKEAWRHGHSIGDDWKKHTLRSNDDNCQTVIYVKNDVVEFVSPSGTSTSNFYKE